MSNPDNWQILAYVRVYGTRAQRQALDALTKATITQEVTDDEWDKRLYEIKEIVK